MSTCASITMTITGLANEKEYEQFINEQFYDGESLVSYWDGNYADEWEFSTLDHDLKNSRYQMQTDSEVRWRPFDFYPALAPLTEKYPEVLIEIRVWWSGGDDGDDCNVSYTYLKNGKYFSPEIKVVVEQFSEDKLQPIKGGFYDHPGLDE